MHHTLIAHVFFHSWTAVLYDDNKIVFDRHVHRHGGKTCNRIVHDAYPQRLVSVASRTGSGFHHTGMLEKPLGGSGGRPLPSSVQP